MRKAASRKSKTVIKAREVGNIAALRSSLKKGAGSYAMQRIPADSSMVVRFLTEPDQWVQYSEYFDTVLNRYLPVTEDQDTSTIERVSTRYLACVVDTAEDRVIALVMPKSLASSLLKKHDKFGTMTDRDYEVERAGSGLDTEYDVTPEAPSRFNVKKYEVLDLMELLEQQVDPDALEAAASKSDTIATDDDDEDVDVDDDEEDEDDDDEDDEEPAPKPTRKSKSSSGAGSSRRKKAAPEPEPEDDDEDDADEDDEDDESSLSEEELGAMSIRDLRAYAKELDIDTKGLKKDDLIDEIMMAQGDFLSEEDIKAMSLAELKEIAEENDVEVTGKKKADYVAALIDAMNA